MFGIWVPGINLVHFVTPGLWMTQLIHKLVCIFCNGFLYYILHQWWTWNTKFQKLFTAVLHFTGSSPGTRVVQVITATNLLPKNFPRPCARYLSVPCSTIRPLLNSTLVVPQVNLGYIAFQLTDQPQKCLKSGLLVWQNHINYYIYIETRCNSFIKVFRPLVLNIHIFIPQVN